MNFTKYDRSLNDLLDNGDRFIHVQLFMVIMLFSFFITSRISSKDESFLSGYYIIGLGVNLKNNPNKKIGLNNNL